MSNLDYQRDEQHVHLIVCHLSGYVSRGVWALVIPLGYSVAVALTAS